MPDRALQQEVRTAFGLRLPQHNLRIVLNRIAKLGLIRSKDRVYGRDQNALRELNFDVVQSSVVAMHEQLIASFRSFARERHQLEWTIEDTEKAMHSYLETFALLDGTDAEGSLRITGQQMRDQRIVLAGAGASAQGIAQLFASALREAGLFHTEARMRICTVDSRGLVTQTRPNLEDFKAAHARPVEEVATYVCHDPGHITLKETVRNFRPTILIGTSGAPGIRARSAPSSRAFGTAPMPSRAR